MVFLFYLILLIPFFWFIRTTKAILFWLYLWQLKEYHLGRFLAHFSTEKGKQIFLNKLIFLKIFVFLPVFVFHFAWDKFPDMFMDIFFIFTGLVLFILYFFESIKAFKDFFQGKLKQPILTKKTIFLISISFILVFLFFSRLLIANIDVFYEMLAFDIFVPLIVSLIVFSFQPLTALIKNQIIKKAKKKRQEFKDLPPHLYISGGGLLVIGITGSYGKTSTKEILYTILSEKFGRNKVLKTKEHQNSEMGISQCILDDLKSEHQIFICEMGACSKKAIKLLCEIAKPKIGILTGINEQHMATFGTQENIIKTKYELIESLPTDGAAFFNAKNKYCRELYQKTKIKKFLYGQETDSADSENIAGAVEVAKELGMNEQEIAHSKEKIKPLWRIEKGINNFNIINSTYSANPDSVISHLDYLKTFQGKKVIIMPCLIELGKASKEVHQRLGRKIAEVCDLAIITTKECFNDVRSGARTGLAQILFVEDQKKIFEKIKDFNKSDDIILLEGRLSKEILSFLI